MNLRKITLRYMGWCPGIDSAAKFIPDVDIPVTPKLLGIVIIIFSGITLLSFGAYNFFSPPPFSEGPLRVYIGKRENMRVFYDYEFNESYDYAQLWEKERSGRLTVYFREKFNRSEYASSSIEVVKLTFSDIEELDQYMRGLGAPNVLIRFTRFMLNQSFEEVYFKVWNRTVQPSRNAFSTNMGDESGIGIRFPSIRGVCYSVIALRNTPNVGEGVLISKRNVDDYVWAIYIDAAEIHSSKIWPWLIENPVYKVKFMRFPPGYRKGLDY